METNKIYCGDVMELMSGLDDSSINCIITSPPYWQLRDYGFEGQWGLEPTYLEYLDHLWGFMDEAMRVLTEDGTVWVNLGDTYSTKSGRMGTNYDAPYKNKKALNVLFSQPKLNFDKCLLLIPHRFAIGCIERGWILRNDIIWAKRNAMPESITDRFSKRHEFIFLFVKNRKYYFDLDGIKDKLKHNVNNIKFGGNKGDGNEKGIYSGNNYDSQQLSGKNPGDVSDFWDIATRGNSESHYASYNTALIEKPIVAGCPEFVCKKCGKAREKIFENEYKGVTNAKYTDKKGQSSLPKTVGNTKSIFIGYTDCNCNAGFHGGIVLDPFCGTGTTLMRAYELGRRFIGFDAKQEYVDIANKRLKPLLAQTKLEL